MGAGSRFYFTLPVVPIEQKIPPPKTISLATPPNSLSSPKAGMVILSELSSLPSAPLRACILVVDDEPVNLQVLSNQLSLQAYQVLQAQSGQEALTLIETSGWPDLILLDVMMPQMTGYEVCRRLRDRLKEQSLPILMLTAKNQTEDMVEGFRAGANDYLIKPVGQQELISRIQTHMRLAKITQAYNRFVPHEFLRFLQKESILEVNLGDCRQMLLSALFSDIRSFTTLSEQMTPEENFKFINSYLKRMEPVIRRCRGVVDKYIGDAIMALFTGSADDALRAALEMQTELHDYNQGRLRAGYQPIQIGIGINTGLMMLGTVGGEKRMDGTVIGDAVNLASRVESLTKTYGTEILVTHNTFYQLTHPENYSVRLLDQVQVKGKAELITIFEVLTRDDLPSYEQKQATLQAFETGVNLYHQREYRAALECWEQVLKRHPQDQAAQLYRQRCLQSLKELSY